MTENVARVEQRNERGHLEDLVAEERIILLCIFKKSIGERGMDLSGS